MEANKLFRLKFYGFIELYYIDTIYICIDINVSQLYHMILKYKYPVSNM